MAQNNCFAQGLTPAVVAGLYGDSDLLSKLKPGQAFILYNRAPGSVISAATVVTYQDIVTANSSINFNRYNYHTVYGRTSQTLANDSLDIISIIDGDHIYLESNNSNFINNILPKLNAKLDSNGLGSPNLRTSYINLKASGFKLSPPDYRNYLQPWIILGLVIAILIPAWYLCRRFLRG